MFLNTHLRRRDFLAQTAAASAVALVGIPDEALAGKASRDDSRLDRSLFQRLLGESFSVASDQSRADLRLVDVRPCRHRNERRPAGVRPDPFSVIFRDDGGTSFQSGIHNFRHPQLGELQLFMHEVGAGNGSARQFEIVVG